jgi:SAM-dependent methyltransferase
MRESTDASVAPHGDYWRVHAHTWKAFQRAGGIRPATLVARFLARRQSVLLDLLSDLHSSARVVDVGCGSGETLDLLGSRAGMVIGLDISRPLLRLAWSAGARALAEADAHHVPLRARSAEAVIAMGLLDYVSDPVQVLRELSSAAVPTGRIIFTYPLSPSPFGWLRRGVGARLRWWLFHLPPIENAARWQHLEQIMADAGLVAGRRHSLWRASWLVEAFPSAGALDAPAQAQ